MTRAEIDAEIARLQSELDAMQALPKRRDRVVCKDGFTMSVQAGRGLYSTPRENVGPYSAVEIGFPSDVEPLLASYAEGFVTKDLTRDVYPYVPVAVVRAVIAKHGGQVDGECPPLVGVTS